MTATAATGLPTRTSTSTGREYGLDWLRVAAFAVLIFYHSGMMFVPWEFHIKNSETSETLANIMLFFNRWRLPLLFFISGCGVSFSLRRRGLGEFAGERLRRLLLPLVFGMFVIIPPQIYFERLTQGATFSYAEFYPSVLQFVPYPKGSFSWHHLWFVAYLLVYCLVGIPLFAWLRSGAGSRAMRAFTSFLTGHPLAIYLINIPSLVAGMTLGPRWPVTHNLTSDWANLIGSFITFSWGFFVASNPRMLDEIERRRREFLIGAVAVTAIFYTFRFTQFDAGLVGWNLVNGYFGMLWIFTLTGYARAKIRSGGPWIKYATEAVYPFYILHQTVLIVAGYYIIQWPWPILPKLLVAMLVTFADSWLGFEIVRRTRLTRLLFGLK